MTRRVRLAGAILPALLLAAWLAGTASGAVNPLIPTPGAVWAALLTMVQDGSLFDSLRASLQRVLLGFLIGTGLGITAGLLNALWHSSLRVTDLTIKMLAAIPTLSIVPLVIIWFGIGETARVVMIAFGVFSIVYINTWQSLRQIDPKLIEMARVYQLNARQIFLHVMLPGAAPGIIVGLRYAMSVSWIVLITAETIATNDGVGFLAVQARDYMQTDIVVLCVLIYGAMGLLSDGLFILLNNKITQWKTVS